MLFSCVADGRSCVVSRFVSCSQFTVAAASSDYVCKESHDTPWYHELNGATEWATLRTTCCSHKTYEISSQEFDRSTWVHMIFT